MKIGIVRNKIIEYAKRFEVSFPGMHWYIFGSVSRGDSSPCDVDILVIYTDRDAPNAVRKELKTWICTLPLDLNFMTKEEDEEFRFIPTQKAEKVYPSL